MATKKSIHSFHIPVMGLAYTIDSPVRVAHYGVSSVISIADDELIEKMRAFYSQKFEIPYQEITQKMNDYRAERIKSYLNLMDKIVSEKFENFKNELVESKLALQNYISLLPNKSEIKENLQVFLNEGYLFKENIKKYISTHLFPGEIDVNIMTKLDKDNFVKDEQLPVIFNDAHAALRGFANSTLNSSVVLSAGMNPRLYSYFEEFPCFFPDKNNQLQKKITLKVSDFRSALIQGNFLAKKGLWVSEYRIESGLNCGGHAFATDGILLGPILEEFSSKKEQLIDSVHNLMIKTLAQKGLHVPSAPLPLKITVQGGVGTSEEHTFLLKKYKVDSIGWGSPFLLVPEATCVDNETRQLLINAQENDLYLSHISPLGVPFNSVKGSTNEYIKQKRIEENKSGSSCPKKFLALHKDADGKGICVASKKYQDQKLEDLELKKHTLSLTAFEKERKNIVEKSCLCVGLANASYLSNNIAIKGQSEGVVVCPGPNIAYFNKEVSFAQMVQHIYGNNNILNTNRPNLFVKELDMYFKYLKNEIETVLFEATPAAIKKINSFKNNLLDGISYYEALFSETPFFENEKIKIKKELNEYKKALHTLTVPQLENA